MFLEILGFRLFYKKTYSSSDFVNCDLARNTSDGLKGIRGRSDG